MCKTLQHNTSVLQFICSGSEELLADLLGFFFQLFNHPPGENEFNPLKQGFSDATDLQIWSSLYEASHKCEILMFKDPICTVKKLL